MRIRLIDDIEKIATRKVEVVDDYDAAFLIENDLAAQFDYHIPDDEIVDRLNEVISTGEYKQIIDFVFSIYEEDQVDNIVLTDGDHIEREIIPNTPSDWYVLNSRYIEHYRNHYPNCSLVGLKSDFYNRMKNSPSQSLFVEQERLRVRTLIQNHKRIMSDCWDETNEKVSHSWYEIFMTGFVPRDKEDYKKSISRRLDGGVENYLIGISLAEYEVFLSTYHFSEPENDKPTQRQIALMHRYIYEVQDDYSKMPPWNEIAKHYGFISPNSGIKIYQHFNNLKFPTDRINYPSSRRDISLVIKMLSDYPDAKKLAQEELHLIPSR